MIMNVFIKINKENETKILFQIRQPMFISVLLFFNYVLDSSKSHFKGCSPTLVCFFCEGGTLSLSHSLLVSQPTLFSICLPCFLMPCLHLNPFSLMSIPTSGLQCLHNPVQHCLVITCVRVSSRLFCWSEELKFFIFLSIIVLGI